MVQFISAIGFGLVAWVCFGFAFVVFVIVWFGGFVSYDSWYVDGRDVGCDPVDYVWVDCSWFVAGFGFDC